MNYKITGIWRINHELVIANTIEEAIELYKTWFGSIEKNCEAEIKEVKRIGDNQIPERFDALIKDGEKCEQEWGEDDEKGLGDALWCCKQAASIAKDENDMGNAWYAENWLKSLKERYTWKPSDEQMKALKESIGIVGELTPRGELLKELVEQLNELMEE